MDRGSQVGQGYSPGGQKGVTEASSPSRKFIPCPPFRGNLTQGWASILPHHEADEVKPPAGQAFGPWDYPYPTIPQKPWGDGLSGNFAPWHPGQAVSFRSSSESYIAAGRQVGDIVQLYRYACRCTSPDKLPSSIAVRSGYPLPGLSLVLRGSRCRLRNPATSQTCFHGNPGRAGPARWCR